MSHKKLLAEGKISRKEFNRLVKYKKTNPGLYEILEKQYHKRPMYFTRNGKKHRMR
jgi:hypothetical protein